MTANQGSDNNEQGRPWYDTKEGIAKSLTSLESLNKMIDERCSAGYQRREKLNEFYFFGRFYLDTCGNCSKFDDCISKEGLLLVPSVLTKDEFWDYVNVHSSEGENRTFHRCTMSNGIPSEQVICLHCGKGWSVNNCHDTVVYTDTEVFSFDKFIGKSLREVRAIYNVYTDAIYSMIDSSSLIRNDKFIDLSLKYPNSEKNWEKTIVVNERGWLSKNEGITDDYIIQKGDEGLFSVWKYYHEECNRIFLAEKEEKQFRDVFEKAGFTGFEMEAIPNQYGSSKYFAPWYNVRTQFGTFTIGWRKRVISIDWSNVLEKMADNKGLSPSFRDLFLKENVTQTEWYIHAWGWDKAQEYLTRIYNHMSV